MKYNVCWNNLDKLHRIVKSKTKPLTYEMEAELHNILLFEKSLLLNEIELVEPDIIIFMEKTITNLWLGQWATTIVSKI